MTADPLSDDELVRIATDPTTASPDVVRRLAELLLSAKRRLAAVAGALPRYGGFGPEAERLQQQRERQVGPLRGLFTPDEQRGL